MDPNTITLPDGRVLPRLKQSARSWPQLPPGYGKQGFAGYTPYNPLQGMAPPQPPGFSAPLPSAPIIQGRGADGPLPPWAQGQMPPQPTPTQPLQTRQEAMPPYAAQQSQELVAPDPAAAAAPEEDQWSATGKTDSFGAFFNKRQGTDALTAFGAAMLKAPNFLSGLADGALAVNQVDRENRMPSEQEIAKANMKYRMANGQPLKGPTVKSVNQLYDPEHGYVTQTITSDNVQTFRNTKGEVIQPGSDIERATDLNKAAGSKLNLEEEAKDQIAATAAYGNLSRFTEMQRLLDTEKTGVGPGVMATLARSLATLSGGEFLGADADVIQQYEKLASSGQLEAAISQKGLGQLTEGEREIIRQSVNTITTSEPAARAIMAMFISREKRLIAMADAWDKSGVDGSRYNSWRNKFMAKWDAEQGSGKAATSNTPPPTPTDTQALRDEADAIVKNDP